MIDIKERKWFEQKESKFITVPYFFSTLSNSLIEIRFFYDNIMGHNNLVLIKGKLW